MFCTGLEHIVSFPLVVWVFSMLFLYLFGTCLARFQNCCCMVVCSTHSSHQATLNSLARNKIAKIPIRQSQPKRAPLKRTTYSRRSLLKMRPKTCVCHKWALSKNNSRLPCSRRLASSTSRTVTTVIHRLHRGMQTKTWRPAAA